MEKIFSISTATPSLLGKKIADDLNQFFFVFVRCTILSILVKFRDFYSCFSFYVIFRVRKAWSRGKNDNNANADTNFLSNSLENCNHENNRNEESFIEDAEFVILDRLMNFCNSNGDMIDDKPELTEVLGLFEEIEPSFEEIKEAFDTFDENGDGYIDASELMKLIWRMGFTEFSVEDCKRMIMPFDENKDGRIEFREFLKLIEQSFQ